MSLYKCHYNFAFIKKIYNKKIQHSKVQYGLNAKHAYARLDNVDTDCSTNPDSLHLSCYYSDHLLYDFAFLSSRLSWEIAFPRDPSILLLPPAPTVHPSLSHIIGDNFINTATHSGPHASEYPPPRPPWVLLSQTHLLQINKLRTPMSLMTIDVIKDVCIFLPVEQTCQRFSRWDRNKIVSVIGIYCIF